ncbi:MAG: alpha/beta hydrolase [Mycobacterium sp.]|nr:alpha/beta hydrolase [Mycobacterium sp.]
MAARAYSPASEASIPALTGQRVRFAHHRIPIDGRSVGVSIGGSGVPLVFFHGIGMNRHAYLRVLNRLPQLGFMVIALDAPGHGQTAPPRLGEHSFDHHIDIAGRVLDELGVRRAVMVGHSMGGRTAAGLAAREPDRALAAVLIGAAVGDPFDTSALRLNSPVQAAVGMAAGLADFVIDRVGLHHLEHIRHTSMVTRLALNSLTHPGIFLIAARAIVDSPKSVGTLDQLAANKTPVAILHGERDMVVPLAAAVDTAIHSNGTLVTLPKAHHSWVLSTPWTLAEILRQLLTADQLGRNVSRAVADHARNPGSVSRPAAGFYAPAAPALDLAPPLRFLGEAEPAQRELYHRFAVWDADALARHSEQLSVVHGR